ncbi:nascent polypeptide-associated complex subunit alpha, muscle-specific form-like isoform X2 [Amphibalanus amphitrite]|uniref:nascent polypeptide-associated complex subunit alpha, muscle-specific form-like isoform X2 n=1 Tax=Amphibalanus amphitrite TaxID=1232801 RepID=UPI001C91E389|nr:nascent polypeptide-associated complex subunit alpha, muscle-specific form-like isoform X2 [Amphibalanus amphitrite]
MCSGQRAGAVAARPTPTTRGIARATTDTPLDRDAGDCGDAADDGVSDAPVTFRRAVIGPGVSGPVGAGEKGELTASGGRWQDMSLPAVSRGGSLGHESVRDEEPRDIYLTNNEPQPLIIHRRAAGRPKPLDIATAQEFILLEGAEGERFATDAFVFSPDGARHIRSEGPAEGAGAAAAAAGAAAGAADRPIAAPAAAGPAAPGNRQSPSQCDLSVAADGPAAPEPTGSVLDDSARELGSCEATMAVPRQEARSWGRPEPAAPPAPAADLPRLHGPGLGYPDWLDTSMEPADTGETSSVGGFFSRVAVSAAPPDAVRLPGLISGSDGSVRRYGPQSAVEVRINRQDGKPPPAAPGRVKGVQFSPLVSEVRWRETYIDEESTDGRSLSPAWDERDPYTSPEERSAPPRPPLPAQHADLRPAGPAPSSAAAGPPQPPPRTDSRPASARPVETHRLRVSYPVDSGDDAGVRRQVVTCERAAADTTQPRTDAAEMERRERRTNGGLTTPPAAPRAAAERPRTMMERLGLGRLSGSRRRATGGQERASPVSRRSPSPGVSSVVVRETEIVSPRAERAAVAAGVSDATRMSAPAAPSVTARAVSPAEAAAVAAAASVGRTWDTSRRGGSTEPVTTLQSPLQRATERLDRPVTVPTPSGSETIGAPEEFISKPPLPPRVTASQVTRARLSSARHQFLSTSSASPAAGGAQPWGPTSHPVPPPPVPDAAPSGDTASDVREAFERFRRQAQEDRARLALSTPDLSLIETTTKQLVRPPSPDPRPRPVEVTTFGHDDSYEIEWGESTSTVRPARGSARPSPAARAWPKVPAARTHAEENLPCKETDLDAIVRGLQQFIDEISPPREKAKSMLNLEEAEQLGRSSATSDSRAKSMEFLLDDENKATTLPPENQLMRGGEAARQLSRHELRFQRSLRNLHTPEWYRRAAVAPTAALRRNLDTASLQGGWSGLSSKSNSKESLPTSSVATPTPVPRRGDWRSFRAARETASVPGTASASPVPLYRRASAGSARRPGPPPTGAPAVTAAQSLRRPYLGWRSQEKLIRQGYQTPVERLASSFRGTPGVRRQVAPPEQSPASADPARPPPPTDDVKTSIREVSDAIVHYFDPDVQGQNGRMGSPATARTAREESPSKHRAMWLETAFVGNRPAEGSGEPTKGGSTIDRLLAPSDARKERFELDGGVVSDIDPDDGADAVTCDGADAVTKRLASVTMDDVLDSLLAMRRPSPPDGPCRRGDPLGEPVLRTRPRRSHPARV